MNTTKANRAAVLAAARMLGTESSVQRHFDNVDAKARGLAAEIVLADASRAEAKKAEAKGAWKRVVARINNIPVGRAGKPDDDAHANRGGMPQPAATAWQKVIAKVNMGRL